MTKPELMLWGVLRTRPAGLKFRRQHPVGPFVLDFYCPACRIAVEVDGIVHDMGDNPARDIDRDSWLRQQGIEVIRIAAADILNDLDRVAGAIVRCCATPLHQPAAGPPPHAAHGED
ncbi:endonuclease domain-containing protein [Croceibacterium sp. TMG7-5b_MA50]|uniref:endonuclease domain-containing protein n=1 Tax=Croceibacterium sp. TMG7-5b_MA50 TaxID=3121290 RepID=UPI003221BCDD